MYIYIYTYIFPILMAAWSYLDFPNHLIGKDRDKCGKTCGKVVRNHRKSIGK